MMQRSRRNCKEKKLFSLKKYEQIILGSHADSEDILLGLSEIPLVSTFSQRLIVYVAIGS
jgi:hypothetical protein